LGGAAKANQTRFAEEATSTSILPLIDIIMSEEAIEPILASVVARSISDPGFNAELSIKAGIRNSPSYSFRPEPAHKSSFGMMLSTRVRVLLVLMHHHMVSSAREVVKNWEEGGGQRGAPWCGLRHGMETTFDLAWCHLPRSMGTWMRKSSALRLFFPKRLPTRAEMAYHERFIVERWSEVVEGAWKEEMGHLALHLSTMTRSW
jgi:hypothetical protein